jgi:rod shape determining protein RodA
MTSRSALDWQLIIPSLILLVFGLAALGSISLNLALTQFIFIIIGGLIFFFFSKFHYQNHRHLISLYTIGSLVFLILPFLFGAVTRGSIRWIQIGSLTLQPSEIIKPFLIIIFASLLAQKTNLLTYFSYLLIPAFLIFKQPDLGSTLVVMAIWLGMLFISDLPVIYPLGLLLAGFGLSPLIYKFLKPYQQQRIISFLNPYADPKASGYHVIQSTIAVGSGGLWGRGLGHGTQSQLQFLPERHTDFIFALIAEEMGLFGSIILLVTYFFLLKRLLNIAQQAPDKFSQLITIGVFSMIFFQAIVTIAMNLGLLPITGITLPLVSSGGSSLLATMIGLGIVHNIYLHSSPRKLLEIR